jgi:Ser/Thr protein kinase RdoA (MazF antagonist)
LLIDIHGEKYYMIEYFEGITRPDSRNKLSEAQLIEAGTMLATLHLLSQEYPGPKFQHLPFQSRRNRQTLIEACKCLETKSQLDDFDKLVLQVVQKKIEFIDRYPFEKSEFLYQNRLTNHGDFHAGNIVFGEDNKIIAVLDFEYCTDMPRIWDVAWAMTWLCREKATEAFTGLVDLSRIRIFLRSYNNLLRLSDNENKYLVDMCVSSAFHTTYVLEHYYIDRKGFDTLEKCQSIDEWLWWANNRDLIRDAIFKA